MVQRRVLSTLVRLLFAGTLLLVPAMVLAQTATLRGTVTDAESKEKLPGASVVVTAPGMSPTGAAADASGNFQVSNLPAGTYTVSVSFIGYEKKVIGNVTLAAGETRTLDIEVVPSGISLNPVIISASRRQEKALDAPAAVSVLEATQIRGRATTTPTDYMRGLPAVDISTNGIAQSNVVVRGFNNIFSGSLLSLVDNRYANVPSLRLNAYNFIPTSTEDIARIEVVSGPGSALYGPNSASGVMHIITRSPFESKGTTFSIGGGGRDFFNISQREPQGGRNIYMTSMRHAGVLGDKLGYKLSAQYYQGQDWVNYDPAEPPTITPYRQTTSGNVPVSGPIPNKRDFDVEKIAAEARLDYRLSNDATVIFSGGYNRATNLEYTGIGAGQAKNWTYSYAQARFLYKNLFIQGFMNQSDAGDTYLLRDGALIVDNSKLFAAQIQHSATLGTRQRFTYGADAILTRPDTDNTINGRNENNDNINELGAYLQSETKLSNQFDVLLAARIDDHNRIKDPVFSPRAALVYKPNLSHTLRATYNRAFSTPSSLNLFLDISAGQDIFRFRQLGLQSSFPFDITTGARTQGVPETGFSFSRSANGLPRFRSPFAPLAGLTRDSYIDLNNPQFTNVMWNVGRGAVLAQLVPQFRGLLAAQGLPPAAIDAITQQFLSIVPQQVSGVNNIMRVIDPTTRQSLVVQNVVDVKPIKETTTETFELGYKGVINEKLVVGVDVYHSRIKNFVGPLNNETPNVFLDPATLGANLGQQFGAALANPANAQLAAVLAALDNPALGLGGNGNGTPVDELATIFTRGAAQIPYGTATPKEAFDPVAILLTYRNFGKVSLNGVDFNFAYYASPQWVLAGNYSFVTKSGLNFFKRPNRVIYRNLDGVTDIALNAPGNKATLAVQYRSAQRGYDTELRARYVEGFPMDSGVFVGEVQTYTVMDFNFGYDLPFARGTRFSLNVQNLLDKEHREFIGAPILGRLILSRLTYSF
ncbi:MAG: TonB-dependent receptor [candidate division KSB1 bacterium]|nr:TonB-dependent receptor [candidate division KSB1 bacterium]MDZ7273391.1 TonB-dependent receptor [candidate division KSB1 bacterium]MDZ7288053.1 TonB-dependent receptor [candidate division KSB1 bacterium]MDZ7300095.1 TonB-dependent receptor [candidate division KSB1 bacterium]MDZ7307219.1 TonB-dependent receptor [candidate division KSB1 bacterium]